MNLGLLGIVVSFVAWEALAGYAGGPFAAMTTASEYVWALETWAGPIGYLLVAAALLLLASHLLLRWPAGPGQ